MTHNQSIQHNLKDFRPLQIVSLLDMLKKYAYDFFWIGKVLEAIVRDNASNYASGDGLEERNLNTLNEYLDRLINTCGDVGLELSAMGVIRLKADLPRTHSGLAIAMPEVQRRIEDELGTRRFLFIPSEHHHYYEETALFGEPVALKFSRINGDVEEAGKCFATGRYTASVFHLMRVMEVLAQTFGQELGITLTTEKVWQTILNEINKAIGNMPASTPAEKAKQSGYAEVSAHLFTVKVAWRNPVMHPKATYTGEEAEDVFRSVKAFAIHLEGII